MSEIWRDLHHTFRQLRRSPAFAATAVLTLALGVGATTGADRKANQQEASFSRKKVTIFPTKTG